MSKSAISYLKRPAFHRKAITSGSALAIVATLLASPALAQSVQSEEIVVTATKKEEMLVDVPIAITAFSGDQLDDLGFASAQHIDAQVPNFQAVSTFGETSPFLVLRGIGNLGFGSAAISPVGMYVDNVYIGQNIAQGFQLFDGERLEVLRGPQGTLFGRNTTGGLINFITRKPKLGDGVLGKAYLEYAESNSVKAELAVNFPLGEKAAARFAFQHIGSDGYFKNANPDLDDQNVNETNMQAGRINFLFEPTDTLTLNASVRGGLANNDSAPTQHSFVDSGSVAFSNGTRNCPIGSNPGSLGAGCRDPFGIGLPAADNDPFTTENSVSGFEDVRTYGFTLGIDLELGQHTLVAFGAWDNATRKRFGDDDGGPHVTLDSLYDDETQWWSAEARLASDYDGSFNWQAGIFYYGDDLTSEVHSNNRDIIFPEFDEQGNLIAVFAPAGTGISQLIEQSTESYALFGSLQYQVSSKLDLRVGLRWTHDERNVPNYETFITNAGFFSGPFDIGVPALAAGRPFTSAEAFAARVPDLQCGIPRGICGTQIKTSLNKKFSEMSYDLSFSYEVGHRQKLHATYSHGFKGGELNTGAFFASEALGTGISDPEFVNSYEFGYKASGLFDKNLNLNLAIFFTEIIDQQVLVDTIGIDGSFFPALTNAARSQSKGVELEAQFQPSDSLFFSLGAAYLDAKFKEFETLAGDASGNDLPYSPNWNVSGVLRYQQPIGPGLASIQLDGSWNSKQFAFGNLEDPDFLVKSYEILNLSLGYEMENLGLKMSLFVRNLTNTIYSNTRYDPNNGIFGSNVFIFGDPRVFGGSLRYEF